MPLLESTDKLARLTNPLQVTRPLLRFQVKVNSLVWGRAPERATVRPHMQQVDGKGQEAQDEHEEGTC